MVLNELPTLIRTRSSQFLPRPFHVVVHRPFLEVCRRGHKLVFLRPLPMFVFFGLKVSMHLPHARQLCIFFCDRLLCKELVHETFDLFVVSTQESLHFRAHAQQKSVLTCAVAWLSPWPDVTILCRPELLVQQQTRCYRQGCHEGLQPTAASTVRQTLVVDFGARLPLFGNCHLGIGLIQCEVRHWMKLDDTGNHKMGIGQSSAKHDGSDRPTPPKIRHTQ